MVDNDHIAADLRKLAVDVTTLTLDPANARLHNDRNMKAIETSLKRFGQRKPIVVQKQGMVVRAGNGTLAAARSLGWNSIAAVVIDEDNLDAVSFAIADNRTGDLSDWDYNTLGDLLTELTNAGDQDLSGLGWTSDELDTFVAENVMEFEIPNGDGENSDFADSPQFSGTGRVVFLIEVEPGKADDEDLKTEIADLCQRHEVTYRVRML